MSPLRAGQLRSRVTLQAKTETPDGQGGTTKTWATVAPLWARVAPTDTSGESAEGDATISRRRYTVTIRKRVGVTSAMRLLRGAQPLEILSVIDDDGARDQLILECREVPL
jgi:SPP1 family predicted phage head-tail adaptor